VPETNLLIDEVSNRPISEDVVVKCEMVATDFGQRQRSGQMQARHRILTQFQRGTAR